MKPVRVNCSGFSLIEVVLALGVASFCLLTLFSLLPIGIRNDNGTYKRTVAANIANTVVADLRSAPLDSESYTPGRTLYSPRFRFAIPGSLTQTQTIFVTESGAPLTVPSSNLPAGSAQNIYRVNVLGPARPASAGTQPQRTASPFYILITWPGQADPTVANAPMNFAGSLETVGYIDQN